MDQATPGAGRELRFLCDEMLCGLGRWLRAAGYDTVIAAGGLPDRTLATLCAREHRVMLTKDRRLAMTVEATAPAMLVPGDSVDQAARALRTAFDIDWLRAPFTRCIVDNRPLKAAPPSSTTQVPEKSRAAGGPLRLCPACGRLYWPGGHVRRMQRRLIAWQREASAPATTVLPDAPAPPAHPLEVRRQAGYLDA
jgi:uncharacterized protein with PIN domain